MEVWDYLVLIGYFFLMAGIGYWSMHRIKRQEDYFMGGRTFGKVLQTFAAFGAGTGSSDPINTARTTFTSGMSGMWSIMSFLFVTPFYWIAGVWYRRMRHLTLGDWFVERYESQSLGVAYAGFGLAFFTVYTAMLLTAISKFATPLLGSEIHVAGVVLSVEYILVPVVAISVIVYCVMGGLTAAYWTDLVQGLCIIALSVMLIPFGLQALVEQFGDPATQSLFHGFRIMHERIPEEYFDVISGSGGSEFPWYRIVAVSAILVVGTVVQPHFIATGGGSAKTEMNARVGVVTGNFLKRFCTIGWALTALIALALMANHPEVAADPDKVWGVASRELLGPGLRGLMLACLLAALMSSVSCYMLVCSALVIRNIYAPYIDPRASDRTYLLLGRLTGVVVVFGAIVVSWGFMNVFEQLQLTWLVPMVFAAPFWVGMYWRRATRWAAWGTFLFATLAFFVLPHLLPWIAPSLRNDSRFHTVTTIVEVTTTAPATASDVARREGEIAVWSQRHDGALRRLEAAEQSGDEEAVAVVRSELLAYGARPQPLALGEVFSATTRRGGTAIYWSGGVKPVAPEVKPVPVGEAARVDDHTTEIELAYPSGTQLQGIGSFQGEYFIYELGGLDLSRWSNAMRATMELPVKIIAPFLVMIGLSLITPRCGKESLDRLYVKMKTPVDPDPRRDREAIELSYAQPDRFDHKKLFPGSGLEFQRPTFADAFGFVACFAFCFVVIWVAVLVARIGG